MKNFDLWMSISGSLLIAAPIQDLFGYYTIQNQPHE